MRLSIPFVVAITGCASSPPPRPAECPPAGTEVPYTKLVSSAFKSSYTGCEIKTTVQFAGSGWGDAVCPSSPPGVMFRVRGPGDAGRSDVLATEGGLAVIPKDASEPVFSAHVGDTFEVAGKVWISEWTGCAVLVAERIVRDSVPADKTPPPGSPAPTEASPPPPPSSPVAPPPTPPHQK